MTNIFSVVQTGPYVLTYRDGLIGCLNSDLRTTSVYFNFFKKEIGHCYAVETCLRLGTVCQIVCSSALVNKKFLLFVN